VGIESTVIALDPSGPRLLRSGAISQAALEELIGPIGVGPVRAGVAQSPGQQRRHYAPAAVVRLAARDGLASAVARLSGRVGILVRGDSPSPQAAAVARLPDDPAGYARGLYAALRDLEDADCAAIVIEEVPAGAEWDAIRDRLARARRRAGGRAAACEKPNPPPTPANVTELARKDLATKLKIDEAKIETESQKDKVWPDGSLGCPKPGMEYMQMQVPGWILELRYNGKTYTYHADSRRVVTCD
jgi:hypothetical protein